MSEMDIAKFNLRTQTMLQIIDLPEDEHLFIGDDFGLVNGDAIPVNGLKEIVLLVTDLRMELYKLRQEPKV